MASCSRNRLLESQEVQELYMNGGSEPWSDGSKILPLYFLSDEGGRALGSDRLKPPSPDLPPNSACDSF